MVDAWMGATDAVDTACRVICCVRSDMDICAVHPWEMFCVFPQLSPFYTHFEKTFVRATSPCGGLACRRRAT